jgi:putative transposase
MPKKLRRITGFHDLHFITFSCYHRRPFLAEAGARNAAIRILKETRNIYRFTLVGYVFMPDHVHMLLSESGVGPPSQVVQVFKQRVAAELGHAGHPQFWQRRYYDFNVHSKSKMWEKLRYMHHNPERANLVAHPGDWPWSSWRYYYRGEGLLAMDAWDGVGDGSEQIDS